MTREEVQLIASRISDDFSFWGRFDSANLTERSRCTGLIREAIIQAHNDAIEASAVRVAESDPDGRHELCADTIRALKIGAPE